jgi:hypothetical protein
VRKKSEETEKQENRTTRDGEGGGVDRRWKDKRMGRKKKRGSRTCKIKKTRDKGSPRDTKGSMSGEPRRE